MAAWHHHTSTVNVPAYKEPPARLCCGIDFALAPLLFILVVDSHCNMRFPSLASGLLFASSTLGAVLPRADDGPQFRNGQPIDGKGKGAPILGGTNHQVDLANPSNLAEQSTDAGTVPNLKWRFSDSKTKIFPGGWVREQVVQDLPQSHDIAAAQQHLKKGAIRELHWHRVVSLT